MTTLTRRRLLQGTAAAGAAAIFVGCAPSSSTTGVATGQASAAAAARRGGTLTWAQWDKIDMLDPANPSGAAALEIIGNVLDTLILLDDKLEPRPLLATKWQIDDGGRRYTFTLRDDVRFHDGTPFDSGAVKRTWDRLLDPAQKATSVAPLLGPVDKITAADPRTLVLTLKESTYSLLYQLWRPYLAVISPKQLDATKPGDQLATLVGTGPFRMQGRSADGAVTLVANPDYGWASEMFANRKAPYLDTVKFRAVVEPATRIATLESGESVLIDEIPEPDYARLRSDPRFTFVEAVRRGPPIGFFLNVETPPTSDLAVRQALNLSVDRKAIVDKVYFGVHRPAVGILTEGVWARVDDLEKRYGYDLAKAKSLLDGAGWTVGAGGIREKAGRKLQLRLLTFRDPWSQVADVVQAQWREAGVDVKVEKLARGPYLDIVRSKESAYNLCASAGAGFDPDFLFDRYHGSLVRNTNFSNLADKQVDALLDKGRTQPLGSPERRKTYEDVQTRLMDLAPVVSIFTQVRVEAMAKKVRAFRLGPDGLNGLPLNETWLSE